MLTFYNAREVFLSYSELNEKKGSQGRYGYFFLASKQRGKNVISEFNCNFNGSCNGYVNSRYMPDTVRNKYRKELDDRLMICFRAYTIVKLKRANTDKSLSGYKAGYKKNKAETLRITDQIIKNTYRTLMTRGMKGCYIYCVDPNLKQYFMGRMKRESNTFYYKPVVEQQIKVAEQPSIYKVNLD